MVLELNDLLSNYNIILECQFLIGIVLKRDKGIDENALKYMYQFLIGMVLKQSYGRRTKF